MTVPQFIDDVKTETSNSASNYIRQMTLFHTDITIFSFFNKYMRHCMYTFSYNVFWNINHKIKLNVQHIRKSIQRLIINKVSFHVLAIIIQLYEFITKYDHTI